MGGGQCWAGPHRSGASLVVSPDVEASMGGTESSGQGVWLARTTIPVK